MSYQPMSPPSRGELNSRPIGKVEFDRERLEQDIKTIESFQMSPAYLEYARGEWKTCMLLNGTGNKDDGFSVEYEGQAKLTEYGRHVPYIHEVIDTLFNTDYLKSARIFTAKNGFVITHRDYREFKKGFIRVHMVLQTNDYSMSSEGRIVYRMREGEIWYLDARAAHSGGSFTNQTRLHLVLDFDPDIAVRDIFNNPSDYQPGLTPCLVKRQRFSKEEWEELAASLGGILTELNYDTVSELIAKLHFHREMDCEATYDMMIEIASRSGNRQLVERASSDKEYYVGDLRKAS